MEETIGLMHTAPAATKAAVSAAFARHYSAKRFDT
jgi:hypothetical protein